MLKCRGALHRHLMSKTLSTVSLEGVSERKATSVKEALTREAFRL